jgi:hypothetical protein
MFVRFRNTARRLQGSIVETHWTAGRVRHEHVASLGSIPLGMTVGDRLDFWAAVHRRFAAAG